MKALLTVFFSMITILTYSQEPIKDRLLQNRFKMDPVGPFYRDYLLGYERMFTDKFSLQLETRIGKNHFPSEVTESGFNISPEFRYYPFKFSIVSIYTNAKYSYERLNYRQRNAIYQEDVSSNRLGLGVGAQFYILKRFLFETGINYGNRWISIQANQSIQQNVYSPNRINSGGSFYFNYSIGFAF